MVNDWAQKLLNQLDLAGFMLLVMFVIMVAMIVIAQSDPDFDFRRMLLDDNEKPSMLRILAVGAWATSTWVLMRDAISVQGADVQVFAIYLSFWSGAPIAARLIDALQAKWTIGSGSTRAAPTGNGP